MEDTEGKPKLELVADNTKAKVRERSGKTETGLTVKQEAFCQAVASGMSHSDGYRRAYDVSRMKDASIHTEASKLACNPAISRRIREIMDAKRTQNTIFMERQREKYSDRVWRNLWAMIDAPETPPAVKANLLSLGAKAAGMLTDQVKIESTNTDSRSIEQELIERLQRLSKTA